MVHDLLSAAARSGGAAVAVVDGERELSYAELDARSSSLAAALVARGVAPGDRVGLLLEKSIEAVIAIYGVLKAGAVYVPLDDQAPVHRLAYIAGDAGMRCVVSSDAKAGVCRELIAQGAPLETVIGTGGNAEDDDATQSVEWLPWSAVDTFDPTAPPIASDPDTLAYILYTSGSTGEPKGVMLSHANCLAFVDWAAREVDVTVEDRLSSHAPFHFDLSTFDLFAAAHGSAAVVLVPRDLSIFPVMLARFIAEQAITVWYSVPSALIALVLRGELEATPLPSLRVVIFAGEVFPIKYLARLMELAPTPRYLNFYGPTETNVCTWHEVPRGELPTAELPIGKPLPGVIAAIELEDGTHAPDGELGELVIGGPTVMHGYWNDPQRTARTLHAENGVRHYRTGDLVRRRFDGELLFAGRRDSQIKTRGYRVELGEIEAALNAIEGVVEAAVVAVPDETITNRLRAFVVTAEPIASAQLQRLCRERLPGHMIPDEIEFRSELPKSSTGKVDRRALQR
ncbi:MAG TPA: amino acid adenylation domain-containing protein [Solirubrobacteraceae bacterium]|nr:amino acid adenylation domain-containing protein [Solirubrobacteraceae bacterium]